MKAPTGLPPLQPEGSAGTRRAIVAGAGLPWTTPQAHVAHAVRSDKESRDDYWVTVK